MLANPQTNNGSFIGTTPSGLIVFVDPPHEPDDHRILGFQRWWKMRTGKEITYAQAQDRLDAQDNNPNVGKIFDHVTVGFVPKGMATTDAVPVLLGIYDQLVNDQAIGHASFTQAMSDSEVYHRQTNAQRKALHAFRFDVFGYRRKADEFDKPGTIWSICKEAVEAAPWQ